MKKAITLSLIVFCSVQIALSQTVVRHTLKSTIAAIDSLHKRQAVEKLYIQTDKPYYAFGDTMRFKAYLLDESLSASAHSGLFYVELVDDSSLVVKRQVIMLHNGVAWGDIVVKDNWYAGDYTLRAYTNWMKNFGQERFFTRRVSVVAGKHWLVNNQVSVDKAKNVNLSLRFSDLAHRNISFRDIRLSVLQGENTLLKQKVKTSPEGRVDINFPLPVKHANEPLFVLAEEITTDGYGTPMSIPIALNRPENTDLQFMPEGGNMVAGIASRVGFKAIGEDGLGLDINGKIFNSKHQEVAAFISTHKGMGSFELTPQPGETYTARVTLPNDSVKSYPLPLVHPSGITLKIDTKDKDSLAITLSSSADLVAGSATYYFIAQARDKALYGAGITFKNGVVAKKIPKSIFPTGVVKWVLLDAANHPVIQRLVFIDHDDRLNISLSTDRESYSLRDSIVSQLTVKDAGGNPVQGDFSLAVTDDSRVKPFDEDGDNVLSTLLLNADVKGNIEQPGYYFNKNHPDRDIALDELLLTQGWAGYDWEQLFKPANPPEYKAEAEYTVSGRASNVLGLPVTNTQIMLMSSRSQLLMNTQTDKHGRFTFNGFPLMDTIRFHIQPAKTFNIGLKIDEFVPPEFTPVKYPAIPWYINSDTLMVSYVKKKQAEQEEAFNLGNSKLLKEVVIKGIKIDSRPPVIFKMDEEEIRNVRKGPKALSTLQLLMQAQKKIDDWRVTLLVDGRVPDSRTYPRGWRSWLYQYNTEDIKGFTIRQLAKYDGVLLEITTNSGRGDVLSGTKGYDFRPMPISWPHQFYSPRYTVKTPATVKDNRSTIYWAPDIITDVNGTAVGSFFSANQLGTYTFILEGTDLNGNIGYLQKKITIHQ